ncbi:MAG: 4-hydroxy-tetrahydrodipicolinate synthase [Rhodospirillaceae bacterium]|nr:4-hydroxy-tetrahydrodipicolinate synthase [Rhodospirillaceae bacterium]
MGNRIFKLHGPCVALPTPFRDGAVDFPALEKLCHRQIARGTAALVPCGPTGEAPLLTPGEHHRIVERTVAAAAGRVPVIAGAGSNNTQTSVELARSAELAGAQALLCITPYYLEPTQAGLIAHFQAIHEAVRIPIILDDVPPRTARPMADLTIERLAELPRIVGLKDATGDIARVERIRWRLGDRFLLLSGDDATQAAHRLAGGDGCISVTANVTPALSAALHKACDRVQTEAVARLEGILAPLHAALFLETNPIPVKRALHRLGLMVDGLRLPLTPLGAMGDMKLTRVLQAVLLMEKEQQTVWVGSDPPPVRSRAA